MNNSLKYAPNFVKFYGDKVQYNYNFFPNLKEIKSHEDGFHEI